MNLGQFHDRIKGVIRRGSSMDELIPLFVAEAAQKLEQNYTFQWMRRTTTVTVLADQDEPNQIEMPNNRVKKIEWIKPILSTEAGGFVTYGNPLAFVDESRVTAISGGLPVAYWLDGLDYIYLDAIPQEDIAYRLKYVEFTDWPADAAATPSLLVRGSAALLWETMLIFAADAKDDRAFQAYTLRRNEAINFLLRSEEELNPDNAPTEMAYGGITPAGVYG